MEYVKNDRWSMIFENGLLCITRGADDVYLLDEVKDGSDAEILYSAWKNGDFGSLPDRFGDILGKLVQAGVIGARRVLDSRVLKVGLTVHGDLPFEREIAECIEREEGLAPARDGADVQLIFRTNRTLFQALEGYEKVDVPHLFIDLAYDHTVSVGPLVFKGETACLRCLAGRIARNWGDPEPPASPGILVERELIVALTLLRLREYASRGSCPDLVNAIWSFDVRKHTCRHDTLLKLPWCPDCGAAVSDGRIDLPWRLS